MKKNSKLVAILTILCLLVTMLPVAAFADASAENTTVVDANASKVKTDDENVSVDVNDEVQINVDLLNAAGQTAGKQVEGRTLVVWAEDSVNAPSTALQGAPVYNAEDSNKIDSFKVGVNDAATVDPAKNGFIKVTPNEKAFTKSIELKVSFARAGKYNVRAAYILDGEEVNEIIDGTKSVKDINGQFKLGTVSGSNVVEVTSNDNVKSFKVVYGEKTQTLENGRTWNNGSNDVDAIAVEGNGITETKIDVNVLKKVGNVGSGVNVTVDTSSNNIETNKTSYTTDYQGKFTIKVSGKIDGEYFLYVTANGKSITIPVQVGTTAPVDLKVLRDSADKLAWNSDFQTNNGMKDFIRIQATDIYGNVANISDEPITKYTDEDFTKVVEKPSNMRLNEKDVRLVKPTGKDYYTLEFKKELKKGKYVIRFALQNGKSITVNFEIADFGTAKKLEVEYDTQSVELNADVAAPTIKLVDENGVVKKESNSVNLGYNGYAVEGFDSTENKGAFHVKNDDKYIGSKITVTAVSQRYGLSAQAVLTVAEDGRTMTFNPTSGPVNANNSVNFQLVDGKGNTIALGTNAKVRDAYVVSKTNEDAKVSVSFGDLSDLKDKGVGEIKVTSDKVTKADIQVVITDTHGKYYGATLTYNFGATAGNASTFVVMNIGKTNGSKNNVSFTMDATPIIKENRTFVPYRALAEAFGAEVKWDDKARTVTTVLDGREVTLTIDSKEITVNGKKLEKQMDVAPYISNDRTMVPVRFVAEELGFVVTPIYNSNNGGTAAVYFAR